MIALHGQLYKYEEYIIIIKTTFKLNEPLGTIVNLYFT